MSATDAFFIAWAALIAGFGAYRLLDRWVSKQFKPPEQPAKPLEPVRWFSVRLGVLELADTGYEIHHVPKNPRGDYVLVMPEGVVLTYAREGQLDALKRPAEQAAAERSEFVPGKPFPAGGGGSNRAA